MKVHVWELVSFKTAHLHDSEWNCTVKLGVLTKAFKRILLPPVYRPFFKSLNTLHAGIHIGNKKWLLLQGLGLSGLPQILTFFPVWVTQLWQSHWLDDDFLFFFAKVDSWTGDRILSGIKYSDQFKKNQQYAMWFVLLILFFFQVLFFSVQTGHWILILRNLRTALPCSH